MLSISTSKFKISGLLDELKLYWFHFFSLILFLASNSCIGQTVQKNAQITLDSVIFVKDTVDCSSLNFDTVFVLDRNEKCLNLLYDNNSDNIVVFQQ